MPGDLHNAADSHRDGVNEPLPLGDRFEILPAQPLPALDGVAGAAYAARPVRGRKAECFAIVCSGNVPPRTDPITALMTLDNPGIMKLLDHGPVVWEEGRSRRLVQIFERPLGRRLVTNLQVPFEPLSEDRIIREVVHSVVPVLKELSGRGMTHGGIRPTNMFLRDAGGSGGLTLIECASTPPGFGQPAVFEPIERAMAQPSGRGVGSIVDDLYAFGVSLVVLALGRNPVQDESDEAVLTTKIERGSFVAIVGNARLPQNLMEPVRGLLLDDPKQRWGLSQLELWMSGRRLSPKQNSQFKRATRPLEFSGQEAWHCRSLARLMSHNTVAAAAVIENGDLDRWLRRGMADEPLAESIAGAVEVSQSSGGKTAGIAERMVARACVVLDPPAPIRYKGKAVMPDGIGAALADAFLRREGGQPLAEIIAWQLPLFWANSQPEFRAELVPLVQNFDTLRTFLEKTGSGYGIERVLYEMNPTLWCLSPAVIDYRAVTPADLLLALDVAATARDRAREPTDRHILAFLATRHRRVDDSVFAQLAPGVDAARRVAAMLTIFGDIQARFSGLPVPGLCKWIGGLMEPTFSRFHNRSHRENLRTQVEKVAAEGKLIELLKIIDDPEAIKKDSLGFGNARRDYRSATSEIERLKTNISDRQSILETTGRQVAAIISCVVGTLIVVALTLFFLFGKGS